MRSPERIEKDDTESWLERHETKLFLFGVLIGLILAGVCLVLGNIVGQLLFFIYRT